MPPLSMIRFRAAQHGMNTPLDDNVQETTFEVNPKIVRIEDLKFSNFGIHSVHQSNAKGWTAKEKN
jgi:hypothetical protein